MPASRCMWPISTAPTRHHIAEASFKALARCLRQALEIDPRQKDRIPSTKGTLAG